MIFVYQHGAWVLVVSEKSIKDYQKSSFFTSQRTYLSMRYDVENIFKFQIFYFILKVWEKSFSTPGRTSSCDKNSRFWFELKFLQKLHFRPNASECMKSVQSHFFEKFAMNHRSEFLSYGAGKGLKISEKIYTLCLE